MSSGAGSSNASAGPASVVSSPPSSSLTDDSEDPRVPALPVIGVKRSFAYDEVMVPSRDDDGNVTLVPKIRTSKHAIRKWSKTPEAPATEQPAARLAMGLPLMQRLRGTALEIVGQHFSPI